MSGGLACRAAWCQTAELLEVRHVGMGSALLPEGWGPFVGGAKACGAVATKE